MPSGNILRETDLNYWRQQLNEACHGPLPVEETRQIVVAYYNYLSQNNHAYGAFAIQVVENAGFIGRLANTYTRHVVKQHGIEWTEEKWRALMAELASTDLEYRASNSGQVIMPEVIAKYHQKVFESAELPQKAWLGTIFEKHGDTGVWMLGQVPEAQHGRPFTVAGVNRLIDRASQSGTEAHRDFAQFISTCLTDRVCYNVLSENLGGFVGFLGRTAYGLDGSLIDLEWHNLFKLYDQFSVRHQVNGCLTANGRVFKSVSNPPSVTDALDYRCTRAAANAHAFAKEYGLEAAKIEIQLEYERSRFRYPMHSELQAIVDAESPSTIPGGGVLPNQMSCRIHNPSSLSAPLPEGDSPTSFQQPICRIFNPEPSHGLLSKAPLNPSTCSLQPSNTILDVFTPRMTSTLLVSHMTSPPVPSDNWIMTCEASISGSTSPEPFGTLPINIAQSSAQSSDPNAISLGESFVHNPAVHLSEPDRSNGSSGVQSQPWVGPEGEMGISVAIPCVIS